MTRCLLACLIALLLASCSDDGAEPAATGAQQAHQPATAAPSAALASPTPRATPERATSAPTVPATQQPVTLTTAAPEESATPTQTSIPAPWPNAPALEEIYARVDESLRGPGGIYHAKVELEAGEQSFIRSGATELWIDAYQNQVRKEETSQMAAGGESFSVDFTRIVTPEADFTLYLADNRLDTSQPRACFGASLAASTLLGCPGPLEDLTTTVERGEFDGRPAIVLVTTGTSRGEDETFDFTEWRYLNAETYLPLATETKGTHTWGPVDTLSIYRHEFIAQDAVPTDHFDPVALALVNLDSTESAMPVYWLGPRFDPEGPLPPLVIAGSYKLEGPNPEPALHLGYRHADIRFHASGALMAPIVIQDWPRDAWDAGPAATLRAYWEDDECGEWTEVALPNDGHATIFMGHLDTILPNSPVFGAPTPTPGASIACPDKPYSRFEAVAYLGETVVFVWAPDNSKSEYASRQGLEAVLRGLQPRTHQSP